MHDELSYRPMKANQDSGKRITPKSKYVFIFLTAAACFIGAIFFVIRVVQPREPRYEGRSLGSWLDDFSSGNSNETYQAGIAVRRMGTNAIPFLLDILSYKESPAHKRLRQFTEKLPNWLHILERDSSHNIAAAEAMNALGPMVEPVYPTLTNLFHNGKPTTAGIALAGIGQKGVLFLVNAMTNQNVSVSFHNTAALALASARSDFDMVVPALIQVLQTASSSARSIAAMSLGTLHHKPEIAVPALIESLNDPNDTLRAYAIFALGEFGPQAVASVPMLLQAINDKDSTVRMRSKEALQKISPDLLNDQKVK